ncbi:MAG TPA: HAD-IA family hydrolase [Solirubrobacterales bacterium]
MSADAWAAIFDVDGTLVDSERDGHRVAFNRAFASADLPYRWDAETYGELLEITGGRRRLNHYLREQGVAAAAARDLARRLHRDKTEIFVAMVRAGEVEPRPGVENLLGELAACGARLAVATTGSPDWVHALLVGRFGSVDFEVVVTRREAPGLKPKPDAYLLALRRLGLSAAEAVAIEDSRNGLMAATRAGLPCAVVTNDYTAGQAFDDAASVAVDFGGLDAGMLRALVGRGGEPPDPSPDASQTRVVIMRAGLDPGDGEAGLTVVDKAIGMPAQGIAVVSFDEQLAGVGLVEKGAAVARLRSQFRISDLAPIEPRLALDDLLAEMPYRFRRHVDHRALPARTSSEMLGALQRLRPRLSKPLDGLVRKCVR